MDYFVVDEKTGNFVTESSVRDTEEGLKFILRTGRTSSFEFHTTKESAELTIKKVQNDLKKFGLHRDLKVLRGDIEKLQEGEIKFIKLIL
jgi:hypothetical protein